MIKRQPTVANIHGYGRAGQLDHFDWGWCIREALSPEEVGRTRPDGSHVAWSKAWGPTALTLLRDLELDD